ncbi:hypothetical protein GGR21_002882 [Dysgonomonas hofstadii]|uniref:Uncharacterized protein n=1 Tax=Dysgonomonas hofstadii TaxID=637886 RepID=A0A840CS49_9BACT|nr:hypothetical protein [Dysgonomonas hofstadii]MBB4036968.1 hypothetical protein [Dysgonomonas hofstadii]
MKEQVLKLTIDNKDAVALKEEYENIHQVSLKVISAQEVLQSILTSPAPLKNIGKIIPEYQRLGSIVGGMTKLMPRTVKQIQETQVLVQKGIEKELEGAKKLSDEHKKKLDEIKKEEQAFIKSAKEKEKADLSVLYNRLQNAKKAGEDTTGIEEERRKRYEQSEAEITKHVLDNNQKRALIIQESMQGMTTGIDSNYEQQKASLLAKYELEAQTIKNATDLTIASEDEKTGYVQYSAADRQAMEVAQFHKLKDLEEKKNAELKKLDQQHEKDKAATFENFIKQRGEKMEVEVDNTSKKLKKSTQKTAKELDDFFWDLMVKEKDFSGNLVNQIVDHSAKSQKASLDAAEAAKKATDANNQQADATKKTTDATKEAAEVAKKYIDIEKTRVNYKTQVEEYKSLQLVIQQKMLTQVDAYNTEIEAAGDNAEKRKEIEAQKLEFIKQTGAELITVQQAITAAEKKEQDLSLTQWKQYAQKGEEVANDIKGFTGKVGDYFSTAFSSISSVYKAEIAGIDEELAQNKVKIDAIKYDAEVSTAKLKELTTEQQKATEQGQTEKAQLLQNEIDYHNGILATKKEYDEKNSKLEDKKAKKKAEQEKIEKLNRKATLLKNIGEATASVAQGVTKALSYGPFLGPVLAAVVAAAGAVQIGIMTKQLAKFADGGLLNGKRHSQGGMRIEGTNIEVEGGEYVVNRESTSKNLGLVRYINSQRKELTPTDISGFFAKTSQGYEPPFRRQFEAGGQVPAIESPNSINNDALVDAIKSIKFAPKVAVTDILRVQDEMTQVDGWSGI